MWSDLSLSVPKDAGTLYVNDEVAFSDVGEFGRALSSTDRRTSGPLSRLVPSASERPAVVVAFLYDHLSAQDVSMTSMFNVASAMNSSLTSIVAPFSFRSKDEDESSDAAASAAASALSTFSMSASRSNVVIVRSRSSTIDVATAFHSLSNHPVVVETADIADSLEQGDASSALFRSDGDGTNFLVVELSHDSTAEDDRLVGLVTDIVTRKSHRRALFLATGLRSSSAGLAPSQFASSPAYRRRRSLLQTTPGAYGATFNDDFHTSDFFHMTPNIFLMIATSLMLIFFLLMGLSVMFSMKSPAQFWTVGQHKESLHRPGILDAGRSEKDYVVLQRRLIG
jgi:hypothetical protein